MSHDCPLCDKLKRLHALPDEEIVWQFPQSVAFLGPWQYYTGYCILVARTHATELHHLPIDVRRGFLDEMVQLGEAIDACFRPRKLNCESLGNQVPHLHWHVFPREYDDPQTLKAVWLALERTETDSTESLRLQTSQWSRQEITARLRQRLLQQSFSPLLTVSAV